MKSGKQQLLNPLAQQPATVNAYRRAAGLVLNRLRWDLDPRSHVSRRRLRKWKDRFSGERAVVVCNGPSLNQTDLSQLQGIFCFGLNKINLLFERDSFRPSCLVSVNKHVIEQNAAFYNQTDIPLFISNVGTRQIRFRKNVSFLHPAGVYRTVARDCSLSIVSGYTVTVVALQLAFHMGFSNVALVGCDHSFAEKGASNATVTGGEKDVNHFDPNYFAGVPWQLPDLYGSEFYYNRCRETFEAFGRRIYNCTIDGKLEIFERRKLENWLIDR